MKAGKLSAFVLSAALMASPTLAADVAPAAPLPSGNAAGTKQATLMGVSGLPLLIIVGSVALALTAGLGGFNNSTASTGTSS